MDKEYLIEVKKIGLKTASKRVALRKSHNTEINIVLQKPPQDIKSLYAHNSPGYELKSYSDYYIEPTNLKKENKRNKEFNDNQRAIAREKAQQISEHKNEEIKIKLERLNEKISADNAAIELHNKQLEASRVFNVRCIPAGSVVDKASKHKSLTQVQATPQNNTSTLNPSKQESSKSKLEDHSNFSKKKDTKSTITSKYAHQSAPTSLSPKTENLQELYTPINNRPVSAVLTLDYQNKPDGTVLLQLKEVNDLVTFDNSTAKVLIRSATGRQIDFSKVYEKGNIPFYPFCGKGVYNIMIHLVATDQQNKAYSLETNHTIDINHVPKNFIGLLDRSLGNYAYLKNPGIEGIYAGMQLLLIRFTPEDMNQVALVSISHITKKEITIELNQIFLQEEPGDIISLNSW